MAKFYKSPNSSVLHLPDDADVIVSVAGETLEELVPNTSDGAGEKHVPVLTQDGNKVTVKVGEVPHPMLDKHWITEVFLETNQGHHAAELHPGEEPQAVFFLAEGEAPKAAYEFCNLHGLWKVEA